MYNLLKSVCAVKMVEIFDMDKLPVSLQALFVVRILLFLGMVYVDSLSMFAI